MHGLDSAPELKRRWTGLDGMLLQNRLGSPELAVSGLEEPRRKKRFRVWIDNFRSSCMPESGLWWREEAVRSAQLLISDPRPW